MADSTYRVTVRGAFKDLGEVERARLLAVAGEHDLLTAGFTTEGRLTYRDDLNFFTFRMVVDARSEEAANGIARTAAVTALDGLGCGYGELKLQALDMSEAKIPAKRRRAG